MLFRSEQGPAGGQHRDDDRPPIDLALLQTQVAGRKAAEPFERMGRAQHGQRRGQGEGGPPTGQQAIEASHCETVLLRSGPRVDLQKLQHDDQGDQLKADQIYQYFLIHKPNPATFVAVAAFSRIKRS